MADGHATRSIGASAFAAAAVEAGIAQWRREVLERWGFSHALATSLAGQTAVDLHDLLTLVDRGCRPELAARILAPLDER